MTLAAPAVAAGRDRRARRPLPPPSADARPGPSWRFRLRCRIQPLEARGSGPVGADAFGQSPGQGGL